jgi:parvulin-like peptidyl-prolyl isomerase
VYYQKRVFPRVQVNADDMRRYYDRNLKAFTQQPQAQFRLIKVDIKKMGDRSLAQQKVEDLLRRVTGGEDFAAVAADYNDDARLRSLGGDVGLIDKGAFALSGVEAAAWALNPGEVSPVVEEKNAFFLVKLERKTEGRTRSFDEEAVQDEIRNTLRSQQFSQLRDKQREQLIAGAVVNPYPPKVEPLLEIIMQKYPYWAMNK